MVKPQTIAPIDNTDKAKLQMPSKYIARILQISPMKKIILYLVRQKLYFMASFVKNILFFASSLFGCYLARHAEPLVVTVAVATVTLASVTVWADWFDFRRADT